MTASGHLYLSTACLHAVLDDNPDLHDYCATDSRRYDGTHKIAASCKFCEPPGSGKCVCLCHQDAA